MKMRLNITKDGINTPGISWGHGSNTKILEIPYQTDKYLLLKKKGSMDTAGIGIQTYYPTRYIICRIKEKVLSKEMRSIRVNEVVDIEPGNKWKKVLQFCIDCIDEATKTNDDEQLKHKIREYHVYHNRN